MLIEQTVNSEEEASNFVIAKDDLKQLMHVFSHDLRNPLVNMDALLRDTVMCCCGSHAKFLENQSDVCENLGMMQDVVKRMNTLIHGVNEVYHAMFDDIHCEWVNVRDIVASEVERRQARYTHSVSVSIQLHDPLWADPLVFRGIMSALLDNAMLALEGDEGGHISIECHKRRGFDVLSVRDSGVGIGESDLNYIFQPFFSLRQAPGMGLARVKAWMQAHGGKTWCETRQDMGSIFYIGFPEHTGS